MGLTGLQKCIIIVTALLCATITEITALLVGINGHVLGAYLIIMGSAAGTPIGSFLEKKRKG